MSKFASYHFWFHLSSRLHHCFCQYFWKICLILWSHFLKVGTRCKWGSPFWVGNNCGSFWGCSSLFSARIYLRIVNVASKDYSRPEKRWVFVKVSPTFSLSNPLPKLKLLQIQELRTFITLIFKQFGYYFTVKGVLSFFDAF